MSVSFFFFFEYTYINFVGPKYDMKNIIIYSIEMNLY